jgi:pSer/pThr/pTyr-binding forkhead associated (FHA) protein/c-di-GMP-binding flagellar brake protein YcgR
LVTDERSKRWNIEINRFPFRIGRKPDCDLALPSIYVSKYHAEIIKEKNFLKITDLGSVNGLYVNHRLVNKSIQLKAGDLLHFNKLFDDTIGFRVISKEVETSVTKREAQVLNNTTSQLSHSLKRRKTFIKGKDFGFSIGLTLYLDFKEKKIDHIKTHLFALEEGKTLIVNIPQHQAVQLTPEDTCKVRFSYDSKVFTFETKILKNEDFPSPRLYLKYPEKISYVAYRKHTRYRTNLRAIVRKSIKDKPILCKVVDISLGGCKVSFPSHIKEEIEGELLLTFEHLINDMRVLKVHDNQTKDAYEVGFKIVSYGGKIKKDKYQEILDFHAPVK